KDVEGRQNVLCRDDSLGADADGPAILTSGSASRKGCGVTLRHARWLLRRVTVHMTSDGCGVQMQRECVPSEMGFCRVSGLEWAGGGVQWPSRKLLCSWRGWFR